MCLVYGIFHNAKKIYEYYVEWARTDPGSMIIIIFFMEFSSSLFNRFPRHFVRIDSYK